MCRRDPNLLVNGTRTFTMKAETSTTTFSIAASTDVSATPSGTGRYQDRPVRAACACGPRPAHHFVFAKFTVDRDGRQRVSNGTIVVQDQFNNIISTGPNLYTGTIHFDAETVSESGPDRSHPRSDFAAGLHVPDRRRGR